MDLAIRDFHVLFVIMSRHDEWVCHLGCPDPLPELPRLVMVAVSSITNPAYRNFGIRRQGDPSLIFQYTLAGCGRITGGRGEQRLPPGSGMLLAMNDPAYTYFYPPDGPDSGRPWRVLWAMLRPGSCGPLVTAWNRRHGYVVTPSREVDAVRRLLAFSGPESAERELSAGENAALAFELLAACLASCPRPTTTPGGLAERALALIERSDRTLPGVGELASRLGVSREHLSRVFKARLGSPLATVIRNRAVTLAQKDLRTTNLSVGEIGRRRGFASAARFGRAFKRHVGVTPGVYRKRLAEG